MPQAKGPNCMQTISVPYGMSMLFGVRDLLKAFGPLRCGQLLNAPFEHTKLGACAGLLEPEAIDALGATTTIPLILLR